MIRPLVYDTFLLSQKADPATEQDLPLVQDLADTLRHHRETCVGMAANMIGFPRRILAYAPMGVIMTMLNPEIISRKDPYETMEGCLCHTGERPVTRYREIQVTWQDTQFHRHTQTFTGFAAQILQHEMDHFEGILV